MFLKIKKKNLVLYLPTYLLFSVLSVPQWRASLWLCPLSLENFPSAFSGVRVCGLEVPLVFFHPKSVLLVPVLWQGIYTGRRSFCWQSSASSEGRGDRSSAGAAARVPGRATLAPPPPRCAPAPSVQEVWLWRASAPFAWIFVWCSLNLDLEVYVFY